MLFSRKEMDKILVGVIRSNQPIAVKTAVVTQISNAAVGNTSEITCFNVLKVCFDILYSSEDGNEKDISDLVQNVAINWMKNNIEMAVKYMNDELLQIPFVKMEREEQNRHVKIMNSSIKVLNEFYPTWQCSTIKDSVKLYFFTAFLQVEELEMLSNISELYLRHEIFLSDCLESVIKMIKSIVSIVSQCHVTKYDDTNERCLAPILKLFSRYIVMDINYMNYAARVIFTAISGHERKPSVLLVKLLSCFNIDAIVHYMDSVIAEASEKSIILALDRIVDWCFLPSPVTKIHVYVIQFMTSLVRNGKQSIVYLITNLKINIVS